MDDIERLFRARNTILEMLSDRGYQIESGLSLESREAFKKLFYSKQLDFQVISNEKPSIYVKWILTAKVKPNFIKDTIDQIRSELGGDQGKIIIVSKAKPNTNMTKVFKEKEFRGTELFWLNAIVFNITKHVLVPKHIKMTEEDVKELLAKLYIQSKFNLPVMLKSDPITRYLDLSSGDVCKIIRYSPTSGEFVSYRVVK